MKALAPLVPLPGTRRAFIRRQVEAVVARVGRDDIKALRRALRDAYPYGERAYWPYKVWCEECRRAIRGAAPTLADKRTLELFDA